jgi:uncharacterized membrane protein YfcA
VSIAALLAAVYGTAVLSGIFGMAGGVILMGIFTTLLPVSAAMVTHGLVQLMANGGRAFLHRKHIQWRIAGLFVLGSVIVGVLLALVAFEPSKPFVFLMLGLCPLAVWTPQNLLNIDAAKASHAILSSVLVTGVNLSSGASGPLLDIFFVRTALNRHQIVATKGFTQSFAHITKIAFYGAPLVAVSGAGLPSPWFFAAMVPISLAGTWTGGLILNRLSDAHFKTITKWIVTVIGIVYLINAARLFLSQ